MPKSEIEQRVNDAGRMLQIEDLMKRKPGQLSGGQRQRVAIGRAVVREPKIFLFDEPLSNLDAELRVTMRGEIASLHQRLGNTMVYVTHDQVEAMTMADKIAVLRAGKLEQYGKPLDLYNYPANTFVAGFIGSPRMNFLKGTIAQRSGEKTPLGTTLTLNSNKFSGDSDEEVIIGVRATHMTVTSANEGDFNIEVKSTEQLGGETYIYGRFDDDTPLTLHLPGQVKIVQGERIGVVFSKDETHLFNAEHGLTLHKLTS